MIQFSWLHDCASKLLHILSIYLTIEKYYFIYLLETKVKTIGTFSAT